MSDRIKGSRFFTRILVALTCGTMAFEMAGARQQSDTVIYPKNKQSAEQISKDQAECHIWSVNHTGVDPSSLLASAASVAVPAAPQANTGPDGTIIRGAAAGAAIGAITTDDSGKGAGRGAGAGTVVGLLKKSRDRREKQKEQDQYIQQVQQAQVQDQAAMAAKMERYNAGFSACLGARDYTVTIIGK
ncbi:MAG: hypothetical protein JKY34_04895 [Kordiimonadaceae bacterium]|nr:hypothetical protein [Kordiimonadaceae bacterium]